MIYCSKCGDSVRCFTQTKNGKYCWKCWNEIARWINSIKPVNSCFLCKSTDIFFEDEDQFKKILLCKNCNDSIYEK